MDMPTKSREERVEHIRAEYKYRCYNACCDQELDLIVPVGGIETHDATVPINSWLSDAAIYTGGDFLSA
jgi:hypothetical protein